MSDGALIERRIVIDPETADALEAWFCEEYQTCWLLHEDEKTKVHELRGYFPDTETADAVYAELRHQFPGLPAVVDNERMLDDKDWREAYKLHFKPWNYRNLHFVPVWERDHYPLPAGEQVIWLDPGMAFGTGNHETTRLCLFRLLDLAEQWGPERCAQASVIDAGCGSGILALAARKCGFGGIEGFDLDPDSVRISIDNATLCELEGEVNFYWAGLDEGLGGKSADVVLANILANVLCQHSTLLLNAVRPGGALILSGILAKEAEQVLEHFTREARSHWGDFRHSETRSEAEWADVLLLR